MLYAVCCMMYIVVVYSIYCLLHSLYCVDYVKMDKKQRRGNKPHTEIILFMH